jgi:signal transduction histidine kinase
LDVYQQNNVSRLKWIPHVVAFENSRLMVKKMPRGNQIAVTDVTPLVERQLSLLRLSIIMLILASILSYLIGRRFVRRALRDVYEIADFVQDIDIDQLQDNLHFAHLPLDDELNTIALSLNQMTSKLHQQIDTIKRFVSNVSHEFKTPLMVMRSQAEVSLKSQHYKT